MRATATGKSMRRRINRTTTRKSGAGGKESGWKRKGGGHRHCPFQNGIDNNDDNGGQGGEGCFVFLLPLSVSIAAFDIVRDDVSDNDDYNGDEVGIV